MIRSVALGGNIIDGPGRVSDAIHAENLKGKYVEKDFPLEGRVAPSGYLPGDATFSTGRYRVQL